MINKLLNLDILFNNSAVIGCFQRYADGSCHCNANSLYQCKVTDTHAYKKRAIRACSK